MDRLLGDTAEVFTLKATGNARRALMSGVTSAPGTWVSRFGVSIRVAQDTASGAVLGPRILSCGRMAPVSWDLASRPYPPHRHPGGPSPCHSRDD